MTLRATSFRRAGPLGDEPYDIVVLDAEQRHIRRKRITLASGEDVLVDFVIVARRLVPYFANRVRNARPLRVFIDPNNRIPCG